MTHYSLDQLSKHVGGEVFGDASVSITGVASLSKAQTGQISFLSNSKYRHELADTQASAVLLKPDDVADFTGNGIILADPYVGFAKIAQLTDSTPAVAEGIASTAVIDPSSQLGEGVVIGPNAVVGANVIIGDRVQIGAGTVIGQDSVIGSDCRLWANVTLYHNVQLGTACIIHSGAVIGSDGFGYANERGLWIKIPQVGGVRIGNNVEIGAGTTVDRGAIEHTEIHDGVIIDNQVQIAHNDIIGAHTAIAGCTTIAGSVTIGKHCIIGGSSAVAGHISIVDGTHISGGTNVTNTIKKPGLYSSATVAMENRLWLKNTIRFKKLDDLFLRVKKLEQDR